MEDQCKCGRTERIASVDRIEYVRCLDCARIFEAEDLDPVPVYPVPVYDDDQAGES